MTDTYFFNDQIDFNNWLEKNHSKVNEVWVGYFKKNTGKAGMTWSESVDVALCFGWIDGIRKSIDKDSYQIRFTPRKTNSVWSAVNVKKIKELIDLGLMKREGLKLYNERSSKEGYSVKDRNVELSKEFFKKIKSHKSAWKFFNNLAPSYRRDSIWWVMSAKKEETRLRRLNVLITSSEAEFKIPSLRKKQ